MSSNPTTRIQTLILATLVGWIGISASAATAADTSWFMRRTGETQEATATITRQPFDPRNPVPYQRPTTWAEAAASQDTAFEYLCERLADGEIRCTGVTDALARLDDAAAERMREDLGDLQQLFELDDVVAIRCQQPFGDDAGGAAPEGLTTAHDALSTWTSIFGTESDFQSDGSISGELSDAITSACNVIADDGSSNSGGGGGGVGALDEAPDHGFCGFDLGDTPDEEIAAMALDLFDNMMENCRTTPESTIMDGGEGCSNEIESAVCNGPGTERVCTGCDNCWVRYNDACTGDDTDDDDDQKCTPGAGETECISNNGDGTETVCDDQENCYVRGQTEPTGDCDTTDGGTCIIDNGDGQTVTVCTENECTKRDRQKSDNIDYAPEEGHEVTDVRRGKKGNLVIRSMDAESGTAMRTVIEGVDSLLQDTRTSGFCTDATRTCLWNKCSEVDCSDWRTNFDKDCVDETCQSCQTLAKDQPKIVAECSGEAGSDIEVCKQFVESAECCADLTDVDVDPRVVRTDPEGDYVCASGEAEIARQVCEEQCQVADEGCQISCSNEYERFLGLLEFDLLDEICTEAIWDACFLGLPPEIDEPDAGGPPVPFEPVASPFDHEVVSTRPSFPTTGTTVPTLGTRPVRPALPDPSTQTTTVPVQVPVSTYPTAGTSSVLSGTGAVQSTQSTQAVVTREPTTVSPLSQTSTVSRSGVTRSTYRLK